MRTDIELRNGYYWPKKDTVCWNYLLTEDRQNTPRNISEFVKNKGVVITAGANTGFYAKMYSEMYETVYAFEPDPLNFYCLTLNCPDNVYKYQGFLGNSRDLFNLVEDNTNIGGHNLGPSPSLGKIPMFRIDDFNFDKLDLLQLDCEGFEREIILGSLETLKKFRPVVCIEIAWSNATNLLINLGYKEVAKFDVDHVFIYE